MVKTYTVRSGSINSERGHYVLTIELVFKLSKKSGRV
jgi:hypothetical protein